MVIDEGGYFGDIVSTAYKRNEQGRILVSDDGLPMIDTKSEKVIGNMMPKWTGSFGNTLKWKDIILSALIDVRYGGQFLSMTDAYASGAGNSKRTLEGRDGMVVDGIVASTGKENTKEITAQQYYSMEEFMLALGEDDLVAQIKESFNTNAPLPSALHDAAMQLYRQYLVVGGMPECVMQFVETRDYILVRHTQDTILASYLNDMSKYNNLNEIKKTRLAYDNITVQLSKKNTRFQYKLIKKGGRASEFEKAIEWLCLSGIVSQVYKVEQVKKPLENYRDIDAFKIYVSDLGLLCAKKDLAANDVLYMVDELDDFKGGMAENYVNMQLSINGYRTYYWESERGAEIDFVIQRDGQLIPVEVKSADNTKAKSLKVYMDTYKPAYAIKLSAKNFGCDGNKKIVPLYAAFCI